jgi:hypothetical protein
MNFGGLVKVSTLTQHLQHFVAISGKTHTEAVYDIHPAEFLVDEINTKRLL